MNISWYKSKKVPTSSFELVLDCGLKEQIYKIKSYTVPDGSSEYKNIIEDDRIQRSIYDNEAIRKNLPTVCYNCHGLTLANRRGWFTEPQRVIDNEGYQELKGDEILRIGDIIAYYKKRNGSNRNIHTGIICNIEGCKVKEVSNKQSKGIKVLSKWGAFGEYIHGINSNPYNYDSIKFYRYLKTNH
ncbi:hypothetical protein LQ318_08445 [Aliifodinibius salicampi]|uniref:CHAP domain-containing protein n=1 Tax=Fodinibius salicampi TaxID=1920655 RepID=A0ABT3PYL0_9BACT|nr:hypothetical protein [Fodinibius salicampi]MCW9712932.1 hypothetical protein [Fodinibius salicampi]